MLYIFEKISARVNELKGFRYRDRIKLAPLRMKVDAAGDVGTYPDDTGEWKQVGIGDRWKGKDLYVWLAAEASIPGHWSGRKALGLFDFGKTGGGGNSGFESLLFVNGKPYQGVDSNHEEVFFPESMTGTTIRINVRLWTGLNGYNPPGEIEHQLLRAEIAWLDEPADDLYYTGRAALETIAQLGETNPERHQLLAALDRAFLLVDWSMPGSAEFYDSVAEASAVLRSELAKLPKHHPVTVQCVGHTHIDVAWLWRLKHTREKAARSFSTVLRLMELFPEYVFLQTQPQLYDYIKRDYPEIYEQIKERVKDGRWEAGGAMWLEADCNLTSGESLVRQLLYGIRFFEQEFGVTCKYLWLPDVFGYSWALPQILRKAGIETFMTTKISWNQYNRMPHDTFMWRGIDGTDILTHFITTPDPGGSEGTFYYTYNGRVTPQSVQGIWNGYRDKQLNQKLLLSYGFGDGGGGVTREMLEMRRRLADMPGIPHVTTGRADTYFAELKERVEQSDQYTHTWDGELYLELHRGTYTSQAYNKRENRKLELLFRETEWLSVLSCAARSDWSRYGGEQLYEGWKIILRNQFHDIIPGSSIGAVYEDSREEYAEARQLGEAVWHEAAARLTEPGAGSAGGGFANEWKTTVFNGASFNRTELAELPAFTDTAGVSGRWYDSGGRELQAQLNGSGDGWIVRAEDVPAMGYETLTFRSSAEAGGARGTLPFALSGRSLQTPHYDIEWNDAGQITRLIDKQNGRSVLADGQRGNVLQVFEDKPKSRHEAWDIDIYYQEKMEEVTSFQGASLEENGPLRAVIRFDWTYKSSAISQKLIVYADSRRIDFATEVDWQERRKLLKAAFTVDVRAVEATYDIQFGNVKRPTHWNTSWDFARFETVGHQWADLSERGFGVSLLNDCKYGYDIKNNVMRLTLIKSANVPDPNADRGRHEFVYALLPHSGDWYENGTAQEAWALNSRLSSAAGAPSRERMSLLKPSCGNIMIDAVKKAEDLDAIVVRVHEYAGARGTCELLGDVRWSGWQECDLLERPVGPVHSGSALRFDVKPFEIKSFILFV